MEKPVATAEQIKALIESHGAGDDPRFLAIAMQVAALEARQGHTRAALEIRQLIDKAKEGRAPHAVPLARPRGELAGLLTATYPETKLAELVLSAGIRGKVERLLHEQRQTGLLQAHGLRARHRVLLVGPPGTGKTLCASALAGELHLPLFKVVLESMVTKFLGETAARLRLVFDAIRETRGVYFFDEFDAIGGRRTAPNDVGEIRRVVNSFLQLLEQDDSSSLVLAATNHPKMLDKALFRRFDDVIEFSLPTATDAERVLRNRLAAFDTASLNWKTVRAATEGLSHAHLTRASQDAAKQVVLDKSRRITSAVLLGTLREQRGFAKSR
jgi:ATP-dependent Clp protease ATP-binding subunit ClpA